MSIVVQYFSRRYPTYQWTIFHIRNFYVHSEDIKDQKEIKFFIPTTEKEEKQ